MVGCTNKWPKIVSKSFILNHTICMYVCTYTYIYIYVYIYIHIHIQYTRWNPVFLLNAQLSSLISSPRGKKGRFSVRWEAFPTAYRSTQQFPLLNGDPGSGPRNDRTSMVSFRVCDIALYGFRWISYIYIHVYVYVYAYVYVYVYVYIEHIHWSAWWGSLLHGSHFAPPEVPDHLPGVWHPCRLPLSTGAISVPTRFYTVHSVGCGWELN